MEGKNYSPDEIAEIEKSRTISDAELLKHGAEYKIDDGGEKILKATEHQIKNESDSFEMEVKKSFEIIPDLEITSAEEAIEKLKAGGYKIAGTEGILKEIDWEEKLNNSYNIVSVSIIHLFGDEGRFSYNYIKEEAKEKGLELIPAKLIPSIVLNYNKTDEVTIATKILHGGPSSDTLLGCNNTSLFSTNSSSNLDGLRGRKERFLFIRKK